MARPFGARGGVTGSMMGSMQPLPIVPVPGVPGGTLMNPVPIAGTRTFGVPPHGHGTGAIVSRGTVLRLAANASRGTGPVGTRASERLVHAGTRTPGVHNNVGLVEAIVGVDIRNPLVAPFILRPAMRAGATRIS